VRHTLRLTNPSAAVCLLSCLPADPVIQDNGDFTGQCVCKAGYGAAGMGQCELCPIGTFSEGATMEACKPCPFDTTSAAGSTSQSE
jgi:hypothetical protein